MQIAHGMAEHAGRYDYLAEQLVAVGYEAYAHDHRGHGKTAGTKAELGFFAEEDGWYEVVADLALVGRHIDSNHPGLPRYLLGHSMGSFLARTYALDYSDQIAGLVLSGTAGPAGPMGQIGRGIAIAEAKIRGKRHRSKALDGLSFGAFNKPFRPNRTDFDWLSRDPDQVDAYIDDPYCGALHTSQFFADLFTGLTDIGDNKRVKNVRSDLPVLLISGAADPVGNNGKGVTQVAEQYLNCGVRDVTYILYPEARHEIFNETNRDEVIADLIEWLSEH